MKDTKQLMRMVEKYETMIYDAADHIWANPEPGFREWKTTAYMEKKFEELGYTLVNAEAYIRGASAAAIMPAIHPMGGGSIGIGHGKDYFIADKKRGCVIPAQCLVIIAHMLLSNGGEKAKKVLAESKPYFNSKEEYLAAIDKLNMCKEAVIYQEDGTIKLDFSK